MPDYPPSIAQHYHERTKYDPATIHTKGQALDWEEQPIPFKQYKLGTEYDLKPYLAEDDDAKLDAAGRWWRRLSKVLYCTYGLTAMIPTNGDPHYLRSSPSAGGLYPAEIYLVSRGTPYLPAGLYNYQVKTHSLLLFWESEAWTGLQSACFWHPALEQTQIALVVSAVFFRSAWRYQDRAYRRIFLDSGHLLGNLELSCSINDFRPHLIGGFADEAVNQLLYFDSDKEGAIAVIPLADCREVEGHLPLTRTALPAPTQSSYPDLADGELLAYFHQATRIPYNAQAKVDWRWQDSPRSDKYNFPFCLKVSTVSPAIDWEEHLSGLERTLINRRSTRAYDGEFITFNELKALLDFTYQPENYIDQTLDRTPDYFDLNLVETFIAVSGVAGLEEGCYYYAPKSQELRQIRFKNFRRELHFLCLGQDLGRDAGAVIFHTADLQTAVALYGDRVYRYLHMDAGHLGQRLNLAAIHLGLGVSGIGGFFDNQVNEVLGIPQDEAVLYITTLGRPRST
jgi:SagB-type dehydrogenase family enzyme